MSAPAKHEPEYEKVAGEEDYCQIEARPLDNENSSGSPDSSSLTLEQKQKNKLDVLRRKAVERHVWSAIKQANFSKNNLIDAANMVLGVGLNEIERELNIKVISNPDDSIKERVAILAAAVVTSLDKKAHEKLSVSLKDIILGHVHDLKSSVTITNMMKGKHEWIIGEIDASASTSDLKIFLENEARQIGLDPETGLLNFIKSKIVSLEALVQKEAQVFRELPVFDVALKDLKEFYSHSAKGVYQITDTAVTEVRSQLEGIEMSVLFGEENMDLLDSIYETISKKINCLLCSDNVYDEPWQSRTPAIPTSAIPLPKMTATQNSEKIKTNRFWKLFPLNWNKKTMESKKNCGKKTEVVGQPPRDAPNPDEPVHGSQDGAEQTDNFMP